MTDLLRRAFPGLLLLALVLLVWWPEGARWRSDDLLATAYASDFGRTLSDFVGAQYGSTDIWLFYRPLITLAFWMERALFEGVIQPLTGGAPQDGISDEAGLAFMAVLWNVLAHGGTTILLWRIWSRLTSSVRAWCIAVTWAVLPTHIEALWWGVGRVDSHTHFWILLSLLLFLRWREWRIRSRWPALVAAALALLSKEQSIVVAPLAFLLALVPNPADDPPLTLVQRLRAALRQALPLVILTVVWFVLRALLLGTPVGGYTGNSFDLGRGLWGILYGVIRILNPLTWMGENAQIDIFGGFWPAWVITLGFLPTVVGLGIWCSSRRRALALPWFLLGFFVAMAPVYAFWAEPSHNNLRYYYTASMILAAVPAAAGRLGLLPMLLVLATPLMDLQEGVQGAWHRAGDAHDRVRDAAVALDANSAPDGPLFVTQLPRALPLDTPGEFVRCLHYGVDRMAQPPFVPEAVARTVLPIRTMRGGRAAWRLPFDPPDPLPEGVTLMLLPDQGWVVAPPISRLPALPVEREGFADLTTESLRVIARPGSGAALVTPGVSCPWYRITIFTGVGYVTAVIQNGAPDGSADGRIPLWDWIVRGSDRRPTPTDGPDDLMAVRVVFQMLEPNVADLSTTYPVLVEGGHIQRDPRAFFPSHRARSLLPLKLDRGFGPAVRRAMGLE